MRFFRILWRYNAVALAVLLTFGLVMATVATVSAWRDFHGSTAESSRRDWFTDSPVTGDQIDTPQGTITVYMSAVADDAEAVRDVRLVAMKTGVIARVADDPMAPIYLQEAIGNLGYVALVKRGERGGHPIFRMVFLNFPDLERFVISEQIHAIDAVQELDDQTFSAVVWDGRENARFIVVDTKTGTIKHTRELDFRQSGRTSQGSPKAPVDAAANAPAPRNKFP